ncbi:polysaccharide export protein [Fertoebacter nigrum]|uniref:Polysaccharide export protein n=1 Tax=Fertoeibacter niger TaxID=2656921 RepID=A0A8X8H4X5_9RHOB|nr:polysaccharide biosynthesis/export family protein [Fertoeibacter niger]NUB46457.1 polysaccharide export protein [Fertoeibacter niger]
MALVLLAACTPMPQGSSLRFDGVVERMAVTAPGVARAGGPACGKARLAAGVKGGDKGGAGFTPTVGYRVGPGDNLKFNIFGEEGLSDITARVDDAGFVQLPIVELVSVGGKTTRDIQAGLKEAYAPHFIDPWVTVELIGAESAPLYFLGEFREPGVRYMKGATNVLEAVALAGGLGQEAYLPGARLLRDDRICTVDLNALLRNGAFEQNVWMKPRDVLFAPRKEDMSVYALGAVVRPQAVAFGAEGRTLLQVLAVAGGPVAGQALLSDVRIIRTASPTQGELIIVDATRMLTGKGLDFPLEPGDVVFVPRSALGDWNVAIGEILPSLQLLGGVLTPITLIESLNNE